MNTKWARWTAIAKRIKPGSIGAEIGTHAGEMSKALFRLVPKLRLIMVDRWEPYSDQDRKDFPLSKIVQIEDKREWDRIKARAVALARKHRGSKIIAADSSAAALEVEDNSLDFVFIDSDHSYEGAKRELADWMPKVKSGGYIMGYHYGDDRDARVERAIKELGKPYKVEWNRCWAMRIFRDE